MIPETPLQSYYKGKKTHRSWNNLPPEIIRCVTAQRTTTHAEHVHRSIATFLLLDVQLSNYCPLSWDPTELWHPRVVYTTLRDVHDIERLMQVSPLWAAARTPPFFYHSVISSAIQSKRISSGQKHALLSTHTTSSPTVLPCARLLQLQAQERVVAQCIHITSVSHHIATSDN